MGDGSIHAPTNPCSRLVALAADFDVETNNEDSQHI